MDCEAVIDLLAYYVAQQVKSVIVSKMVVVLKVHLVLMKLGLTKPTIAIILLLL